MTPDLADPSWFLDDLDFRAGAARFVRADRAALAGQPFLDQRWPRTGLAQAAAPLAALPAPVSPRLNFIWHTAFCCSTLIAACLDAPGKSLSLKEPPVLMTLANAKRNGAPMAQLAPPVFGLLARRFAPGEQILVKPTNAANNLAVDAAAATEGKALLLWSDCRSFILSLVKKGEGGRAFARNLFGTFAMDGHEPGKWPPRDLLKLTDLQIAALVWQMQVAELRRAADRLGPRAASLDADRFLADPAGALNALDAFFGLGLGPDAVAATVAGPLLRRDSKNASESFDAARRTREADEAAARIGPDLDRVVDWSFQAFPQHPKAQPLPRPMAF